MSEPYRIIIVGDDLQLQMVTSHLHQELRFANVRIIPIQLGDTPAPSLRHAFTPFDKILQPLFTESATNLPKGFDAISLKLPQCSDGFKFNFSTYGVASSAVNFSQAFEVAKANDSNTPAFDQFITKNKSTFGIVYSQEEAREKFRQFNIENDRFFNWTQTLEVIAPNGHIEKVITSDGQVFDGDLFIDCSTRQHLIRSTQEQQDIPQENLPPYQSSSVVQNNASPNGSTIQAKNDLIECKLSTGETEEIRTYDFEHTGDSAFYFEKPWINNCVALGNGYCQLPELLVCTDRILEIQLHVLTQFLPIHSSFESAQKHFAMYSQRAINDAIDSINLILFTCNIATHLTNTNKIRTELFETSGAAHQRESLMITGNCWAGLMYACGLSPKSTNAITQARPAASIIEAVKKLAVGD